jgi:hypothetical protein
MKHTKSILLLFMVLIVSTSINGQEAKPGDPASSVASSLNMYVFPAKDQSADQQDKDETECYKWAVQQSGVDPMNPPEVKAAQVNTGPDGSAVVGAAGGAAAGAAIGAIAGDAGKGAAIGAVAGALRGRRASRVGHTMEQAAADIDAQQTQEELINNFKKAFTACLEGKGYTVK